MLRFKRYRMRKGEGGRGKEEGGRYLKFRILHFASVSLFTATFAVDALLFGRSELVLSFVKRSPFNRGLIFTICEKLQYLYIVADASFAPGLGSNAAPKSRSAKLPEPVPIDERASGAGTGKECGPGISGRAVFWNSMRSKYSLREEPFGAAHHKIIFSWGGVFLAS